MECIEERMGGKKVRTGHVENFQKVFLQLRKVENGVVTREKTKLVKVILWRMFLTLAVKTLEDFRILQFTECGGWNWHDFLERVK